MPYYFSICDNCFNSEIINEEHDIHCSAKDKNFKRKQCIRHCTEYDPIRVKKSEYPRVFLE